MRVFLLVLISSATLVQSTLDWCYHQDCKGHADGQEWDEKGEGLGDELVFRFKCVDGCGKFVGCNTPLNENIPSGTNITQYFDANCDVNLYCFAEKTSTYVQLVYGQIPLCDGSTLNPRTTAAPPTTTTEEPTTTTKEPTTTTADPTTTTVDPTTTTVDATTTTPKPTTTTTVTRRPLTATASTTRGIGPSSTVTTTTKRISSTSAVLTTNTGLTRRPLSPTTVPTSG